MLSTIIVSYLRVGAGNGRSLLLPTTGTAVRIVMRAWHTPAWRRYAVVRTPRRSGMARISAAGSSLHVTGVVGLGRLSVGAVGAIGRLRQRRLLRRIVVNRDAVGTGDGGSGGGRCAVIGGRSRRGGRTAGIAAPPGPVEGRREDRNCDIPYSLRVDPPVRLQHCC